MRLSGTRAIAVLAVGLLGVDLESLVFDPERRCDSASCITLIAQLHRR